MSASLMRIQTVHIETARVLRMSYLVFEQAHGAFSIAAPVLNGSVRDAESAAWTHPAGPPMNNALKMGASLMHAGFEPSPFYGHGVTNAGIKARPTECRCSSRFGKILISRMVISY